MLGQHLASLITQFQLLSVPHFLSSFDPSEKVNPLFRPPIHPPIMSQSLSIVLAERPKGPVIPGQTFHQKHTPIPSPSTLQTGEILIETLYLSLDPAMRGWLDDVRSYVPPVQIGETMRGSVIARVLASQSDRAAAGDIVVASTGWRETAVAGPKDFETVAEIFSGPPPTAGFKLTDLQGVLGMTGLTAYFGMETIGKPKRGETVVVSGAAGATGSVAAQMAKIAGARVVGLAGSDDKCQWLEKELGFDVCLNYKDKDFKKKFKEATPNYIDVYWDNGELFPFLLNRDASDVNGGQWVVTSLTWHWQDQSHSHDL